MNDKLAHFLVGVCLYAVLLPFGAGFAIAAVTLAAVGKEVRDALGYGTPEWKDAGATVLGGLALLAWHALLGVTL